MTTYNKIIKLFLAPIIAVLFCTAVTGCKDDEVSCTYHCRTFLYGSDRL